MKRSGKAPVKTGGELRIDHPRSIETLERALADKRHEIVRPAARALASLGWKPRNEVQRVRYLIAAGRTDEAGDLIPRARPVDGGNRLAGTFELDKPILTPLTVGTPEWPEVVMIRSVEFRNESGDLKAVVQLNQYSWPASTWKVLIELRDDRGRVVAGGETAVKTAGFIITVRLLMTVQPHELSFGRVDDVDRVRRFELSVEQVADDRHPPSTVDVTRPAEAPLSLAADIPVRLEAKGPDRERLVWTETIRFDEGAEVEGKKQIQASLRLQWAALRKADWRVWLLLLDEEGATLTRSGGRFSTEVTVDGPMQVRDESLEIPLTVRPGRDPARFRLGLERIEASPQQ